MPPRTTEQVVSASLESMKILISLQRSKYPVNKQICHNNMKQISLKRAVLAEEKMALPSKITLIPNCLSKRFKIVLLWRKWSYFENGSLFQVSTVINLFYRVKWLSRRVVTLTQGAITALFFLKREPFPTFVWKMTLLFSEVEVHFTQTWLWRKGGYFIQNRDYFQNFDSFFLV